jgi:hypothetical protein
VTGAWLSQVWVVGQTLQLCLTQGHQQHLLTAHRHLLCAINDLCWQQFWMRTADLACNVFGLLCPAPCTMSIHGSESDQSLTKADAVTSGLIHD